MNNFKSDTMRKIIIFLIVTFFLPLSGLVAQNNQNPGLERLNAFKIGFFTRKLNLTTAEAEKFWPIYDEYQKQKNLIQVEKVNLIRNFNQNESTLNDNQITEIGDKLVATIVKESELEVSFHNKLKETLPPAKVIRFYQAENQFKAQLLKELQNAKQQQETRRRNF
jgi:hypothetical protein